MGKYTKEILEPIVAKSNSYSDVVRNLGLKMAGGTSNHIKNRIKQFGISTDHFDPWAYKYRPSSKKKHADEIFIILPSGSHRPKSYQLRNALIEVGVKYACSECGISEWMNKKIVLEIDHVDGNFLNNLQNNLRFLCPNCHSQTDNFKSKNI